MTRTYRAPAKINLWLRVFPADDTGYHPLDTLFCAIDLQDEVAIGPGDGIQLGVTGADVGPIESNLAYRAAQEYFRAIGASPNISIELHKNIPAGAGLGGGSSDAAAVLRALQEQHDHALPTQTEKAIAARLGSDVPFFLCGSSWARARGRGEILEVVPSLPRRQVLVLKPDFPIATRDAYRWLDESDMLTRASAPLSPPTSWGDVAINATNTFEGVLFERYPILREMRDALNDSGAAISLVSGSGSALFGIFEEPEKATAAYRTWTGRPDVGSWLINTLT
jgi:4-diphosphocytidyl-2-C-methyl-D-erythritol kinase